jgi:SAM-dependent methyltransferase
MTRLSAEQIADRLRELSPEIPWAHHFQLAEGVETVTPADEKFYQKSVSLTKLAQVCKDLVPKHTRHGKIRDLTVLDVACGEGCHSIELARAGAKVCGIEGRPLYIARAQFVSEVFELGDSTKFVLQDVRTLSSDRLGRFDLVLVFGILHHLNQDAFIDFLTRIHDVAADTVLIYVHIATELSVKRHRLKGPVKADGKYEGYLFQEHAENASKQQRLDQVRASLDNTYSFWPTEEALIAGLTDVGFSSVFRSLRPHLFQNYQNASYRPILICRR